MRARNFGLQERQDTPKNHVPTCNCEKVARENRSLAVNSTRVSVMEMRELAFRRLGYQVSGPTRAAHTALPDELESEPRPQLNLALGKCRRESQRRAGRNGFAARQHGAWPNAMNVESRISQSAGTAGTRCSGR